MTEVRLIRPPGKWPTLNLREIILYRELIWVFVKRGIFSRYRQMALGITWSFLEPLGLLLLMSIVFGYLIRVPTGTTLTPCLSRRRLFLGCISQGD